MRMPSLNRWSGFALIMGGILLAISSATHPLGETSQYVSNALWVPSHFLSYIAWMLILPGLIGLYTLHWEKLGRAGLVGMVLVFIGGSFLVGASLIGGALLQPFLVAHEPSLNDALVSSPLIVVLFLMSILFLSGYFVLEIAILRAAVLPGWVAWLVTMTIVSILLGLGIVLVYVLASLAGVLLGISLAGWGYANLSKTKIPV